MRIDPAFIQAVVAFAALVAALYGVVTVPLLKRMDDMRGDIKELREDVREMRTELKNLSERLVRVEARLPGPMVHQ